LSVGSALRGLLVLSVAREQFGKETSFGSLFTANPFVHERKKKKEKEKDASKEENKDALNETYR
jgi:hypothetical protein